MKNCFLFTLIILLITLSCKKDDNNLNTENTATIKDKIIAVYRSKPNLSAYYISSVNGNDSNDGRSVDNPWKTLDRLHKVVLKSGDIVRLARGSVFQNQNIFLDNGSAGIEGNPVIIEAYGEGNMPIISQPRALWDKNKPVSGVYFGASSCYITVLDLLVKDTEGECGFYVTKESHHIAIVGNEIYRCGTGIGLDGKNQKVIGNVIHEMGYDGKGSGIGIGFAGSNLEMAWNTLTHCIVLLNGEKEDGSPFEYYGRRSDSDYDLSDNISIHHNIVDDCLNFIEAYGNATNMVIAYNLYKNSSASPFQIHFDDSEHTTWTHECTYDLHIENNTMVTNEEPNDGGWGIVGLLVDWKHLPDTNKSKVVVRNNLFVTNHTILSWINPLGENLIHDHNLFYFINNGSLSVNKGVWPLDLTEAIVDPKFVNMNSMDFRINNESPAINAGINSAFDMDILGNPVSMTGSCDAGAYQHD